MARKRLVIDAIRAEIDRLEQDLALEAGTRLKLHAMNEHLVGVLRDMEQMAEEVSSTIAAAHNGRRTGLKLLIDRLKLLIRNWRSFKIAQRVSTANRFTGMQDDEAGP